MSTDSLAQITFRANTRLKEKTLSKTQKEGITLKALLSFAMQAYINNELIIGLRSRDEVPSPYLIRAMKEAEEEYQRGDYETFDNAKNAIVYLNKFKKGKKP